MTPEQYGDKFMHRWDFDQPDPNGMPANSFVRQHVIELIREAIAEQREADAKIADAYAGNGSFSDPVQWAAGRIAKEIRSQGIAKSVPSA